MKRTHKARSKTGAGLSDIPLIKWPHWEDMMAIVDPLSQSAVVYCSLQYKDSSSGSPLALASTSAGHGLDESPAHEYAMPTSAHEEQPAVEVLPADGLQMSRKRRKRDVGDKSQQDLAETCLGHLGALKARTEAKKDDIFHFCMRLDCRLRAIPKVKAQSFMNKVENMMYNVEKECSDWD